MNWFEYTLIRVLMLVAKMLASKTDLPTEIKKELDTLTTHIQVNEIYKSK